MGSKMKKIILLTLLLASFALAQAPTDTTVIIPKGSKVWLHWIAPPDTDVVTYRIYATHAAGVDSLTLTTWYQEYGNSLRASAVYNLPLPIGEGYFDMIAIDRTNLRSVRSNKARYKIIEIAPGAPLIVQLQIM
jgi:hypothetical protein